MIGELLVFLVLVAVVAAGGVAVGMLVIAPRLDRWAERDAEPTEEDG